MHCQIHVVLCGRMNSASCTKVDGQDIYCTMMMNDFQSSLGLLFTTLPCEIQLS